MTKQDNLRSSAKAAVLWSFVSQFSSRAIQFVIGLILARLLSPSDYGIVAMPMVFLAIAQCFIDSGFASAIIRKPDLKEEDLSTAFYFNIVIGIVCYTILFFASPLIANFYNVPILADILKVTALSTLFGPLMSVHYSLFSRNLDFKTPTKISVFSTLFTGIVGITLAFLGFGIWALVFQGVAGQLLSLVLVWSFSNWKPKTGWSNESFKSLFGFGSKILVSGLIDTIYNNINAIIIGKYYSAQELGYYNRGKNYAVLPHDQVSGIISKVSYPVLSQLQKDEARLNDYFRKILRLIIFILSPLELMLAALARPLIIVMITEKWESAIIILQILCFSVMFWPIQSFNMSLFKVKGRSDLVLKSNIFIKVVGLIIKFYTLTISIVAICIGNLVHSIIAITWTAFFAGKFSHFGVLQQFRQIAKPLLLSITMFCLVTLIIHFIDSYYWQIFIGGSVGAFFYISMAILVMKEEWNETLYLLHIKKK